MSRLDRPDRLLHLSQSAALRARASRRRVLAIGAGAAAGATLVSSGMRSTVAQDAATSGLLPANRILLYYGFPENENMGILGEQDPASLLETLNAQAEEYRATEPTGQGRVRADRLGRPGVPSG